MRQETRLRILSQLFPGAFWLPRFFWANRLMTKTPLKCRNRVVKLRGQSVNRTPPAGTSAVMHIEFSLSLSVYDSDRSLSHGALRSVARWLIHSARAVRFMKVTQYLLICVCVCVNIKQRSPLSRQQRATQRLMGRTCFSNNHGFSGRLGKKQPNVESRRDRGRRHRSHGAVYFCLTRPHTSIIAAHISVG